MVFPFFADAFNLEKLTPPWLHFKVLSDGPITMQPGAVIDYRLRLHGIGFRWSSLIAEWEPPLRFVDVQRRGPYRYWRHEHLFEERDGGTWMTDRVAYRVPGGSWLDRWLVGPELARIFDFRARRMQTLFAARPADFGSCPPLEGGGKENGRAAGNGLCL